MKKVVFALGVLFPFSAGSMVASSEIWAPGVTRGSGWYDVNKYSTASRPTSDKNFCWAAVASNMLQWWFDRYEAAGQVVPSGIPVGPGDKYNCGIFEKCFLPNWGTEHGSLSFNGLNWFFQNQAENNSGWTKPTNPGGYFPYKNIQEQMNETYADYRVRWETLNTDNYPSAVLTQDYSICLGGSYYTWGPERPDTSHPTKEVFSNYLTTMLGYGPVGLSLAIGSNGRGTHHEITVWGCDVDEEGSISKIFVSDSDDASGAPLEVVLKEYLVNYTGNNVAIYYNNEAKLSGGNYITSLTGIMAYPIPEPLTFGLLAGLGAFALAGTRRSRKSK